MRVVAIIQARLNSSRFPRKVLADIGGKPLIAHVVERVARVRGVDEVAVAPPDSDWREIHEALEVLAGPFASYPYTIYSGGADEDVLARYAYVASESNADVILRITGDCPLFAPDVAERALQAFRLKKSDYASNDVRMSGYPDGMDVQVFSRHLLEQARQHADDMHDREHVCPWMEREYLNRDLVAVDGVGYGRLKLSVDTPEDLERVRKVYAALDDPQDFSFASTIRACAKVGLV